VADDTLTHTKRQKSSTGNESQGRSLGQLNFSNWVNPALAITRCGQFLAHLARKLANTYPRIARPSKVGDAAHFQVCSRAVDEHFGRLQ
jgi:hypothetical protein